MFGKNMWMPMIGGIIMLMLAAVAVVATGLMIRKQTSKLRSNMRSVSRGIYKFGSALQLLSGADDEDDCERSVCC